MGDQPLHSGAAESRGLESKLWSDPTFTASVEQLGARPQAQEDQALISKFGTLDIICDDGDTGGAADGEPGATGEAGADCDTSGNAGTGLEAGAASGATGSSGTGLEAGAASGATGSIGTGLEAGAASGATGSSGTGLEASAASGTTGSSGTGLEAGAASGATGGDAAGGAAAKSSDEPSDQGDRTARGKDGTESGAPDSAAAKPERKEGPDGSASHHDKPDSPKESGDIAAQKDKAGDGAKTPEQTEEAKELADKKAKALEAKEKAKLLSPKDADELLDKQVKELNELLKDFEGNKVGAAKAYMAFMEEHGIDMYEEAGVAKNPDQTTFSKLQEKFSEALEGTSFKNDSAVEVNRNVNLGPPVKPIDYWTHGPANQGQNNSAGNLTLKSGKTTYANFYVGVHLGGLQRE